MYNDVLLMRNRPIYFIFFMPVKYDNLAEYIWFLLIMLSMVSAPTVVSSTSGL